jgi:hypothetical protein
MASYGERVNGMWSYFLEWLFSFTEALWKANERPEARRFTLGCAAVLLAAAVALWLFFR